LDGLLPMIASAVMASYERIGQTRSGCAPIGFFAFDTPQ
jgi:hypothetical protein